MLLEDCGQLEHFFRILFGSGSVDHHVCRADGLAGPAEEEVEHSLSMIGLLLVGWGRPALREAVEDAGHGHCPFPLEDGGVGLRVPN